MECKDLQSQGIWSEGLGTPVMSATEIMAVLRSFGMGKFAAAVMYVLQETFENEECSDADEVGEQQFPAIGQQLSKKYYVPWMICEPNEKEGQLLVDDE